MSTSRTLPKFDAVHFETLSHKEKLELLNHFLDALNRSQPRSNATSEEVAVPVARHARSSSR